MLNFGYQTILFPEVWKAVSYAGLDFHAGYLHADRPGKPSLVLDLMEEFRQQVVDRVLIGLITKKVIKPDEIVANETENGRVLSKKLLKLCSKAFRSALTQKSCSTDKKAPLKGSSINKQDV